MAIIRGNNKSNTLSTTVGNDKVYAMAGDDWIIVYGGKDEILGSTGNDTLSYAGAMRSVHVDLAITKFQSTGIGPVKIAGFENLVGSIFSDTLLGDKHGNLLAGENGNDRLYGRDGNDLILGGSGNDFYSGGNGRDTASFANARQGVTIQLSRTSSQATGEGNDKFSSIENILGSEFNDVLIGNGISNTIYGGKGNDYLAGYGAAGARKGDIDTLVGGAGNDIFAVLDFPVSKGTFIQDFRQGEDLIRLDNFKIDDFSQLTQVKRGGVTFVGFEDLTLSTTDKAVVSLKGNFTLTADDFII